MIHHVTEAVAEQLGASPADISHRLHTINAELSGLTSALDTGSDELAPSVREAISATKDRLAALEATIATATAAGPELIDAAIRQAGAELGSALAKARRCDHPAEK